MEITANMDYDDEPITQNDGIWSQLNGHGRVYNDIGCSFSQSIIRNFSNVEKGDACEKEGGARAKRKELKKDSL